VGGNALVYAPSTHFQVGLLSKYVGKQYMGNINSENSSLPSYFISDINAVFSWQPKKWVKEIQWSTTINNIFNLKYLSNGYFYTYDDDWTSPGQTTTIEGAGYYPQAGLHFLSGLKLIF